jgi:ureidoglycolate lyase
MQQRQLVTRPLTSDAFRPFGRLVTGGQGGGVTVNAGTAERYDLPGQLSNATATAVPTLAVYRCRPQRLPACVPLLERHPLTSQTFVPLSGGRWLIVVAPTDPTGEPDLDGARAFLAARRQGVTYAPGVWHSPLIVLDEPADLAMLMWEVTGPADCEVAMLSSPLHVQVQP